MQSELDGATAKLNEAESRLYTTRTEITETWVRIGRLEERVQAPSRLG